MGNSKRRRKKTREKKRRERRRDGGTPPRTALACYRELSKVFGEDSAAMLRLGSDGATPVEIAERLGVPLETAQRFIDKFVALPDGFDTMLLRAPSLLSKKSQMRSMVRSAVRAARRN